ncbi:MAG: Bax inhibitor-1 family protein [Myxococcota bacterium]
MSVAIAHAAEAERLGYLRRVLALTFVGLSVAGVVGVVSAVMFAMFSFMLTGFVPMVIILGCWAVSNFVAQPMVFSRAKWAGFALGTVTQGVAMGFLLLVAASVSAAFIGNPLALITIALGLTGFSGLGMAAYCWGVRRDFSMLGAGLSAVGLPMLILMGVSFAFPGWFGGTLGIVMSAAFVLVSAGGLLYQLDRVMHDFTTDMHVEGAYTITMGLLVLFWNILSLLMRLTRR